MPMTTEGLRSRLVDLTENMSDYSDEELRNIKSTADVFSMKIRMELAARDARIVDQACALPESGATNDH
jgi:hypothetical protein